MHNTSVLKITMSSVTNICFVAVLRNNNEKHHFNTNYLPNLVDSVLKCGQHFVLFSYSRLSNDSHFLLNKYRIRIQQGVQIFIFIRKVPLFYLSTSQNFLKIKSLPSFPAQFRCFSSNSYSNSHFTPILSGVCTMAAVYFICNIVFFSLQIATNIFFSIK